MSSSTKIVNIGIMPLEEFKKRTIKIVKGEYQPREDEPKIWFPSIKSLANVLSEENQHLLKLIIETKPGSIAALESVTGRKANNLLRTLRKMERYGIVALDASQTKTRPGKAPLVPRVLFDVANIQLNWN